MRKFRSFNVQESVLLNLLKAIYLRFMKIEVVTVVKFGVDNTATLNSSIVSYRISSDGTGCFRINVRTGAAELTYMRIAGLRN